MEQQNPRDGNQLASSEGGLSDPLADDGREEAGSGSEIIVVQSTRTLWILIGITITAIFGVYEVFERFVLAPRVSMETLHALHILRGVFTALIVGGIAVYQLMRRPLLHRRHQAPMPATSPLDWEQHNRDYLKWFIHMRWIALGVSAGLIVASIFLLGILDRSAFPLLFSWWILLLVANLAFVWWSKRGKNFATQTMTQVIVDLVVLTGYLNASGGLENPLYTAYLFHLIIAAILLPRRRVVLVIMLTASMFLFMAIGEYLRVIPHFTLSVFPHAEFAEQREGGVPPHASHDGAFVFGQSASFVAVLFLTAYFTSIVIERLRRSEESLERAARTALLERRKLAGVIDAAGVGMIVTGLDMEYQWFNQRAADWLSLDHRFVGQRLSHDHDSGACLACMAQQTLETRETTQAEKKIVSGAVRYLRMITSPVQARDGRVVQLVHLVEDVTRQKELEAEALHAGKMSVLGQVAAGIAHEIGNPLASLDARLHLLKRRLDQPEFLRESLDVLKSQIDRIGRIVHGVSNFARNRPGVWERMNLNDIANEALKLLRLDQRTRKVDFIQRLDNELPGISGVKDQIMQVVINLLLNAIEAMPDGGTLTIETAKRGAHVELIVMDTGVGIDEGALTRIFEPFFTTKEKGTGLGLSVSHSLVHAHGGQISVGSETGRGSRFVIRLPMSHDTAVSRKEHTLEWE